jgi:hypothetical protein
VQRIFSTNVDLAVLFIEQAVCLYQICGVEAFGEPVVAVAVSASIARLVLKLRRVGRLLGARRRRAAQVQLPRATWWERLLPLPELALRVPLRVRLVLEDNGDSVQAAELRSVTVEVLASTITHSSSVEDLANSLGLERGPLSTFARDQPPAPRRRRSRPAGRLQCR